MIKILRKLNEEMGLPEWRHGVHVSEWRLAPAPLDSETPTLIRCQTFLPIWDPMTGPMIFTTLQWREVKENSFSTLKGIAALNIRVAILGCYEAKEKYA